MPTSSPRPAVPEAPPRSLADQLRRWSDEQLAALLRDRPDLATPAPHDSVQLASRAATRSSLLRALDLLTELELQVLDAVVVAGRATRDAVVALVRADAADVEGALDRLLGLALVWEGGGLRTPSGVADALRPGGSGPSGLHPFATAPEDGDAAGCAARAAEAVAAASAPARALLEHVDAHGGTGASGSARRTVALADAASPVEEAIARRLLVPRDDALLVLPGDVAVAVRGGRTTRDPVGPAPAVATSARDAGLVDRAAAGAAFEAVRRVELLLDQWGTHPPKALRAGGLAVRDLKATATTLHVGEPEAALLVEVAHAAGLLAPAADTDGDVAWVPTDRFDAWSTRGTAERWVALATAWLGSSRTPALVGTKDQGGKTRNALSPDLASSLVAEVRRAALALLAELPEGEVLAAGTGLPSLVARARWVRPRRPRVRDQMLAWGVEEAQALGLVALGGLASYARPLVAAGVHGPEPDDERAAADRVAPLLPLPVDHVLLQADLTAVAPGPLETALARRLQLVADVESRGGATTYRFHPGSVRRAFDAGWSAAEVHAFLDEVSRTPVPQPLAYLVDDAARTFGTVRVGHAEAFLRADDEAALTELLHHPKAGTLGLRRIAPTVLVSDVPVDVLLPRLRELGAAPVVEAPDGTVRVARPDLLRARTPKDRRAPGVATAREAAHLTAVVTAVRAGDRAAVARPAGEASGRTPAGAVAALREAAEAGRTVLISYVDNHGTAGERLVRPLRVEGGVLTAHDERADDERGFAVHRITAVRPVAG